MEQKLNQDEFEMLAEARLRLNASTNTQELTDDTLICECMCLTLGSIRERLKGTEINPEFLKRELGLGTGCSTCLKSFDEWKDSI